jgi:hypothetical protein
MDFEKALQAIKQGLRVTRRGWNDKGMFIELRQKPYVVENDIDACKTSSQFIHIRTADGNYVPWVANQTDLLAEDWEICFVAGAEGGQRREI